MSTPTDEIPELSYERRGDVVVWTIHDFETLFGEKMETAEQQYYERSSPADIRATVVIFEDAPSLGPEEQDHMHEAWSELGASVDVDRLAYVADGIAAMAIEANVEVPGAEVASFDDTDEAIAWAADDG